MKTLLGQEGGTQKVILQVGRPLWFYFSVRTPLIGKRKWNLRLRVYGKTWPRLILGRTPK